MATLKFSKQLIWNFEMVTQRIISILLVVLLSSCSAVKHSSKSKDAIGKARIAGVGDVVLRVDKYRSLLNAFGKADIFGRKTKEGFSEIRFAGVETDGTVVFYRKDVLIHTNETTMSRTPISSTRGTVTTNANGRYSGNSNNGTFNGSAQTNYSSTTVSPASDYHVLIPLETIPIRLSAEESKFPIEGHLIEVIKATRNMLEFRISKY